MAKPILLVEDDAADVLLTIDAFERRGIVNEVEVVRDGQSALDYLFAEGDISKGKQVEQPAVILLDLNLPGISGLEVLRAIRQNEKTRGIPVVILTTSKDDEDIIQSYDSGANSYIQKPVDPGKFMEAVGQIGKYWLLLNENSTE